MPLALIEIDELVEQLSSPDWRSAEAAYDELCRRIGDVKGRIYYQANRDVDRRTLCYLIELLGESKDAQYFLFIKKQLDSGDIDITIAAYAALLRLGTPESRALHYSSDLRKLLPDVFRGKKTLRCCPGW